MTCISSVETILSVGWHLARWSLWTSRCGWRLWHVLADGVFCYQPPFPGFLAAASPLFHPRLVFLGRCCPRADFLRLLFTVTRSFVPVSVATPCLWQTVKWKWPGRRPRYLLSTSLQLIAGALRTPFSLFADFARRQLLFFLESRQLVFSSCAPSPHTRSSCVRYVPMYSKPDSTHDDGRLSTRSARSPLSSRAPLSLCTPSLSRARTSSTP
jgi:hypothetical protein